MFVGEEVINRAIKHLNEARRALETELKRLGDAETAELVDKKEELESQREDLQIKQEKLAKYLDGYQQQKQAIETALREMSQTKDMQERRDLLSGQRDDLIHALSASRNVLAGQVSAHGYQAYLRGAIHSFLDILSGLNRSGELPAPFKATFVKGLLHAERCICDRPLVPGEAPFKAVEEWLQRTGMSDLEQVVFQMKAEVESVERSVPDFFKSLDREQQSRSRNREQLSKVEDALDKIRDELRGSREEDARQLEDQRLNAEKGISETTHQQVATQFEIRKLDEEIRQLREEITRRQGINAHHDLAKRRLIACQDALEVLQHVRELLRTNFREDLAERINDLFSQMSFKPYRAVLDPDYCLSLVDGPSNTPVGLSTGESALLSLSFIGAVINQARDLVAHKDRLPGPDSSVFPVVMDSPFGNLDPNYRRQLAQNIPDVANQVLLMATKSQFEGNVETTLYPKIGKEFVLKYHSPKEDAEEDRIVRYGRIYDLVLRSAGEEEWTEIIEVTRQ